MNAAGSTSKRVVIIGAAGEMGKVTARRLLQAPGSWHLVLCDNRPEPLHELARSLPANQITVQVMDLFDRVALRALIKGADLVILGAGPYVRTSDTTIDACLELKVPYLDYDDDVESTESALTVDQKARAAGIPVYVCCGVSPGLSNVLAVDAASDLDTVDIVDVGWLIGEERPNVGRNVLEHMLDISYGDCVTWEGGRRVTHETFTETAKMPIVAGEPDVLLYEMTHPEAATLPRRFPQAQRIRCLGGLDPAALNGMSRGLGLAVEQGRMTLTEAVDFFENISSGGMGSVTGWRESLRGMVTHVRRGENTVGDVAKFFATGMTSYLYPYKGGIIARVYGTRNGKPAVSTRRSVMGAGRAFNNMGGANGAATAAFALLAIEQAGSRAGAFAPEDWADPAEFYRALEQVGVPRHEIVETVT